MARLQMIQIDGADDMVSEDATLCASPIACAVADAWSTWRKKIAWTIPTRSHRKQGLYDALDALEAATRESPLRKVRP